MRGLSIGVLGVFLVQTILAPVARAREASAPTEISHAVEQAFTYLHDAEAEVVDGDGHSLDAEAFLKEGPREFTVADERVQLRVKVTPRDGAFAYTVVAVEAATGKTLSRRAFQLDTRGDAQAVSLKLEQTARSMEQQIEKQLPVVKQTWWNSLKQMFGIPSAYAGGHGIGKLIRLSIGVLAIVGIYHVIVSSARNGTSFGKGALFVVLAIILLSAVGCDSPPPGYKRNPGYDAVRQYAPPHVWDKVPKYVPDDDKDE